MFHFPIPSNKIVNIQCLLQNYLFLLCLNILNTLNIIFPSTYILKNNNFVCLQSHLIVHNVTAGIMPQEDKLFIKNVKENLAGHYACSATNVEGETYSAPLELVVQCKLKIININFKKP